MCLMDSPKVQNISQYLNILHIFQKAYVFEGHKDIFQTVGYFYSII